METNMPKIRIAPQDLLGLRKIITELTYMAIAMEQGKATPFGAEQIRKYVARLKDCEAQRVEALHKEPRRGGLVCIDGCAINPERNCDVYRDYDKAFAAWSRGGTEYGNFGEWLLAKKENLAV